MAESLHLCSGERLGSLVDSELEARVGKPVAFEYTLSTQSPWLQGYGSEFCSPETCVCGPFLYSVPAGHTCTQWIPYMISFCSVIHQEIDTC